MSKPPFEQAGPGDRDGIAAHLFGIHLADLKDGQVPDAGALSAAHPEHAVTLRALCHQWHLSQAVLDDAGRSVHVTGGGVDDSAWRAFIEQLQSRGPAHTRYVFKGEIARGGMGVIQRVYDQDIRRPLAMKVILGKDDSPTSSETPEVDDRTLGRFLEEAQVTGQLDHPGIVPVHEVGVDTDGQVYFTMKLVKGEDLRSVFDRVHDETDDSWNQTRALGLIHRVCEAMAYAHDKQVIHRDLKPGNVMVGKFGEVYVMDWGLARVLGQEDKKDIRVAPRTASQSELRSERREASDTPDEALLTMDGDVVGTPAYMPPEQAEGRVEQLGPGADIYALGAMLYHLLSGHMPYVPKDAQVSGRTVLGMVLHGPPPSIGGEAPDAPGELIAICEKAMSREIGERYLDMTDFARDLRAFLEDRVVSAYESGAWAELKKWVVRNKGLSATAAVALVSVLALWGWALAEANRADENAATATTRAEDAEREKTRANDNSALATARAEDAEREKIRADENAALATKRAEAAERSAQNSRLLAASGLIESGELRAAGTMLSDSPKDRRDWVWEHLLACTEPFVAEYWVKDHTQLEGTVGISTNSEQLMIGCKTGLALFDTQSGERVGTVTTGQPIATAFAAQGGYAATLDASGALELRETVGWSVVHSSRLDVSDVFGAPTMRISDRGELVAISLVKEVSHDDVAHSRVVDGTLFVWHPERDPEQLPINHTSALALHPTGSTLYISHGARAFAISAESLDIRRWYDTDERIKSIAHDGRGQILLGLSGGSMEIHDEESGERRTLRGHRNDVTEIAVANGSQFAFTSAKDGRLCRWDLEEGDVVATLERCMYSSIIVSPDQGLLVGCRQSIYAVSLPAFFESGRVTLGEHDFVSELAFSGDGQQLVSLSPLEVRVWDCKSARLLRSAPFEQELSGISHVDVSRGGGVIAAIGRGRSTTHDRLLWIWDAKTLDLLHHQELNDQWEWTAVCFSGERLLLSMAPHEGGKVIDAAGGRVVTWSRGAEGPRLALETESAWIAIQPWGDHEVLVGEASGRVGRWNADPLWLSAHLGSLTEDLAGPLSRHDCSLIPSPDQRRVWVHSDDLERGYMYEVPERGEEWKEPALWEVARGSHCRWVGEDLLAISGLSTIRFRDAVSGETRLSYSSRVSMLPSPIAFDAPSGQIAMVGEGYRQIVTMHSDARRAREAQIGAQATRAANSLVTRLAADALTLGSLVDAIRSAPDVPEGVRDQALRLAPDANLAIPESLFWRTDALDLVMGLAPTGARKIVRRLELIREAYPDYPDLRFLGVALYRSGDYSRALEALRASERSGDTWEAMLPPAFEALALAKLGMIDEAVEIAGRTIPELRGASQLAPYSGSLNPLESVSRELEEMVRLARE